MANSNWADNALEAIASMPRGYLGTGEQIRLALTINGLRKPHNNNSWGALVRSAVNQGILKNTGRKSPMAVKKAHARSTPVYQVL